MVKNIPPNADITDFVKMIETASRKTIPRGCQTTYIPCLSPEGKQLPHTYTKDPFSEETVSFRESLNSSIAD
jgi:hypothetical protein